MSMQHTPHNPAASYSLGVNLWSHGQRPEDYIEFAGEAAFVICPITVMFGWKRIDAQFMHDAALWEAQQAYQHNDIPSFD